MLQEFPRSISSSTGSTNSVLHKIPWLSLSPKNALLAVFISPKLLGFLANPHQDQHFVEKIYFQPDFKMWTNSAFCFVITAAVRCCRGFILLDKPWTQFSLIESLQIVLLFWEALRKHITYNWLNSHRSSMVFSVLLFPFCRGETKPEVISVSRW